MKQTIKDWIIKKLGGVPNRDFKTLIEQKNKLRAHCSMLEQTRDVYAALAYRAGWSQETFGDYATPKEYFANIMRPQADYGCCHLKRKKRK